jgi:hypothetical protein
MESTEILSTRYIQSTLSKTFELYCNGAGSIRVDNLRNKTRSLIRHPPREGAVNLLYRGAKQVSRTAVLGDSR